VVLYELLTGSVPFSREDLPAATFLEMLRIIREADAPKPSTKLSSSETLAGVAADRQTEPRKLIALIRGELDWIVSKCLEKDRGRRYETANGLAMDLQRYLANEPVGAGPPSLGYRLRKFARRNRGRLAATALVLFLLASLGVVACWAAWGQAKQQAALEKDIDRTWKRRGPSVGKAGCERRQRCLSTPTPWWTAEGRARSSARA
jgi:hypothetical protein